ncbi:hypothetical protein GCM10017782_11630 [Deinococcus ficus]|nr:hypothetical protein GCM10017782_11630 [Deinococcus ficus]
MSYPTRFSQQDWARIQDLKDWTEAPTLMQVIRDAVRRYHQDVQGQCNGGTGDA